MRREADRGRPLPGPLPGPRRIGPEGLDGVLDQAAFEATVAAAAERTAREGRRLGVALFAVEFTDPAKDGHGMDARDRALREFAVALRRTVRGGEAVGWVGGCLFAWLLPVADEFAGWDAAERVRRTLQEQVRAGEQLNVAASVCELSSAASAQDALWRATVALYWGKANGSGVSFRYSPEVVALLSAEKRQEGPEV
jgi:diguanylate cyclase (GGDEF)-like protein